MCNKNNHSRAQMIQSSVNTEARIIVRSNALRPLYQRIGNPEDRWEPTGAFLPQGLEDGFSADGFLFRNFNACTNSLEHLTVALRDHT